MWIAIRWGIATLAVAGLVVAGFIAWSGLGQSIAAPRLARGVPEPKSTAISVHVSGAVARQGVVELRLGDRIQQAVDAAGGALPSADLSAVNLALKVRDEQQIHIPARGDPSVRPATAASALVNINTAGQAQLEALRGIGPARARAVVDHRTKHGRFNAVDDLVTFKLVPASVVAGLRDVLAVD